MTRAVCLLCCGYVLLAVQLVLPGEAIRVSAASLLITGGAILWLLLPWIAAIPDRSTGVMTAAVYGLAIDCVGGLHPGLLLGSTVALTAMLQSLPWSTLLMTGPRVAASSFVCSLLPAMAVSSVSLVLRPGIVEPKTLVAGFRTGCQPLSGCHWLDSEGKGGKLLIEGETAGSR
jgi:hypothetical protein